MSVPNWYELALLALAAWRIFQLLAHDDILDRPRRYVTRLGREWQKEGDSVPKNYRANWMAFIECPYCAGFWIALLWWGAWQLWPHGTLVAATLFALSAIVIGASKVLSSEA